MMRRGLPPPAGGDSSIARTIMYMRGLVNGREGAANPNVRALAVRIVANVPSRDAAGEISAVFSWVKQNIRFRGEFREMLQTPLVTLQLQAGDCDDHAVLLGALLRTLGYRVRFRTVATDQGDPQFTHVYAEALNAKTGEWVALDTTVDQAYPGWRPPQVTRSRAWRTLGQQPGEQPVQPTPPFVPPGLSPKGQALYAAIVPNVNLLTSALATRYAYGQIPRYEAGIQIGQFPSTSPNFGALPWYVWAGGVLLGVALIARR